MPDGLGLFDRPRVDGPSYLSAHLLTLLFFYFRRTNVNFWQYNRVTKLNLFLTGIVGRYFVLHTGGLEYILAKTM